MVDCSCSDQSCVVEKVNFLEVEIARPSKSYYSKNGRAAVVRNARFQALHQTIFLTGFVMAKAKGRPGIESRYDVRSRGRGSRSQLIITDVDSRRIERREKSWCKGFSFFQSFTQRQSSIDIGVKVHLTFSSRSSYGSMIDVSEWLMFLGLEVD